MENVKISGDSIQAVALALVDRIIEQKQDAEPDWKPDEAWLANTYDRFCTVGFRGN